MSKPPPPPPPQLDEHTGILDADAIAKALPKRRNAMFVAISGNEAGQMYKLETDEIVIGRAEECEVRLAEHGVSRRHARIVKLYDGSIEVEDLGSRNGTFCNGERVTKRRLNDGDKIQVGETTIFKFSLQDALEEDFLRRQYEWATRDTLTGCFNRKYFADRVPGELAFCKRYKLPLSMLVCDIDHFKTINDTYGHPAGDTVLKGVAKALGQAVRQIDILARWGGEEFAVVMRDANLKAALMVAERARERIERVTHHHEGQALKVTISVGVAEWHAAKDESPEELVRRADEQLYRAKALGRNRVEAAGPSAK